MWASLGVLAVAVIMIVIAAQQMFINDQDLGFLLWIMIPATIAAAMVAYLLSAPIARDVNRLSDAAMQVANGDLTARTGVIRNDELGDAAREFDRMVVRLGAVEQERALMLSSISHDLRTPLAALRASVEAIRDGVAPDPDAYLNGMEHQVQALGDLVDDLQLHTRLASGTLEMRMIRVDLTELADEAVEIVRPLAQPSGVTIHIDAQQRLAVSGDPAQLSRVIRNLLGTRSAIRLAIRMCGFRSNRRRTRWCCGSSTTVPGFHRRSAGWRSSRSRAAIRRVTSAPEPLGSVWRSPRAS